VDKQRRAVAAHLEVCPMCRKEEVGIREMIGSFNSLPEETVSSDFNAKLLNRIASERFQETRSKAYKPKNAPIFGWSRAIPVVATACLVLAFVFTGGINILNDGPSQSVMVADNGNNMTNDYMTVDPTNNPNMKNVSSNGNFEVFQRHVDANWAFNKQLARTNRIKNYMNSLVGYNGNFGSSQNGLSSIIVNPEMPNVLMRLPFNQPTQTGNILVTGSH
jgi:hypothetical protein